MKQNYVDLEYKKYPAQMLEVAGDLRRAPAKFENPVNEKKGDGDLKKKIVVVVTK